MKANSNYLLPAVALVALAVGWGLGWMSRGASDRGASPQADSAPELPKSAVPRTALGVDAPEGLAGGGTSLENAQLSSCPLGLNAADIMADIVRLAASGQSDRRNLITRRLALLEETGAEGQRAILEFLKRGIDFQMAEHENSDDRLRDRLIKSLRNTHTPESEEAMRYLVAETQSIEEAIIAVNRLSQWELEVDEPTRQRLVGLAIMGLNDLPAKSHSEKYWNQAIAGAVVIRDYGSDEQLVAAVLRIAESDSAGSVLSNLLPSLDGPGLQQRCLEALGAESEVKVQLAANDSVLKFSDYAQPAVQDLLVQAAISSDMSEKRIADLLKDDTMMQNTKLTVNGENLGYGQSTFTQFYETPQSKVRHMAKLEGLAQAIGRIETSPKVSETIQNLAAYRLEQIGIERVNAEKREVRQ